MGVLAGLAAAICAFDAWLWRTHRPLISHRARRLPVEARAGLLAAAVVHFMKEA